MKTIQNLNVHLILISAVTVFSPKTDAAISLFNNVAYNQDFNSLPSAGSQYYKAKMPNSWTFVETGLHGDDFFDANERYGTPGAYSYGTSSDTAFGGIASTYTLIPVIGASFTNNVGVEIISISIAYTGEQWRLGTQGSPQHVDFQYSTDATNLTNGTWTNFDILDLYAAVTTGVSGSLGGNNEKNRTYFSGTIPALEVATGEVFWIRWDYASLGSTGYSLAIDDFSIVAVPESSSSLLSSIGAAVFLLKRRRTKWVDSVEKLF